MSNLKELLRSIPQVGKVELVSIRPVKRGGVKVVDEVTVTPNGGLEGDHSFGKRPKRQVTLIQSEHLDAMASILKIEKADPTLTRRNIVVSGVNLLAFNDLQFQIGEAILEMTGHCHPCSRMETNFGPGGYNSMRGHGGITAKVIRGGKIRVGDEVFLIARPEFTSGAND